jgi:hypothetical protein
MMLILPGLVSVGWAGLPPNTPFLTPGSRGLSHFAEVLKRLAGLHDRNSFNIIYLLNDL